MFGKKRAKEFNVSRVVPTKLVEEQIVPLGEILVQVLGHLSHLPGGSAVMEGRPALQLAAR